MDNDVCFSVNEYDKGGDKTESGIYLHFGETKIRVAETIEEFCDFADEIACMIREISDNRESYGI